jgi:hypothetical protein
MPSIDTEVASVVRQVSCTWSPAEITVGVAVSCAVGAGAAAGGALLCGRRRLLFLASCNSNQGNKQDNWHKNPMK